MENTNYIENLHKQIIEMVMENHNKPSSLHVGENAPEFSADTTFGPCKMSDYSGKWLVFFSHPGDFTPVCTTEFISFAKYNNEFNKRNCCLLGLSIDSNSSHLAWVYNIYKTTGIQIPFPVIADRDMRIAKMYGMFPHENMTQTVRSVFIIDPNQKIRAILMYPMTNGRYIPEILRLLEALQTTDNDNVATPANWMPGQPVIVPYPKTYDDLLERVKNPMGYNCMDWYLCFKQGNESPEGINSFNMPMSNNSYTNMYVNTTPTQLPMNNTTMPNCCYNVQREI